MSSPAPARSSQRVAGMAVGLITLLFGIAYAVLGGSFFFSGTAAIRELEHDPAGGLAFLLQFLAGFVAAIGAALLVQGLLGILAGGGVLLRKPWGRILALIVATLAIPWGLLTLGAYDQGAAYIALGAAQILYGIFALVVLIKDGAEFSRPRV